MGNNIYEDNIYGTFGKKTSKIKWDNTKHYPNQDEASLLRKIMSDTGLSEEQVREVKKYRVMLSDAQKQGQKPKRGASKKYYQNMIKVACKQTGLVPQHPDTIKVLDDILQNSSRDRFRKPWWLFSSNPTAKTIVRDYAN